MLFFGSLSDMDYDKYDEIWLIVRFMPKTMPKSPKCKWHPELSPSKMLFNKYKTWKKNGEWNETTFSEKYVPLFLDHIKYHDPDAVKSIQELIARGKKENILCVCFCKDENLCHRSIIKGLIQGSAKASRDMTLVDFNTDYSRYNLMYFKKI